MSDLYDPKSNEKTQRKEREAREKMNTPENVELGDLVKNRWTEGEDFLREARKDFQLNRAFYLNRQWIVWNNSRGIPENLPARFSDTERVRVTDNQMEPRIDTLIGVLTERDLVFEGDPSDADDSSMQGSQLAEAILEAARQQQGWETIRREEVLGALLGGISAVSIEWNGAKGERLWVNEQNQQVVGTGEVQLTPMTIDEFTLEPGSRTWQEANWWVGLTGVPCAQVRDHYGLDWTPEPDFDTLRSANFGGLKSAGQSSAQSKLCSVYVMYERPNRKCPKGRCIAVVNGIAVKNSEWKFPFNELNIALFRQGMIPGQWNGKTFVTAARPVQVLLNAARSNIAEHMKMASNARLFVPIGALDDVETLTDEAGEIIQYHAEPNMPAPDYKTPPALNPSMVQYAENLTEQLSEILHANDVSRGVAPGDRNSGLALSILAEKNNTPLGPMAHDQSDGWSRLGQQALKLYAKNVDSSREAVIVSRNGVPSKWSWQGSDLRGQTTVRVPIDAVAPYTRAQMLANLQNLQQLNPTAFQALPHDRLIRLMGLSSAREIAAGLNPDVAKAHRENDRMMGGEPVIPADFDDHAKHIAEHNSFRKSNNFEFAPEEIKELVKAHIEAHERLAQEELMGQATMNSIAPGMGALPQAHDPMGSAVPDAFSMSPQLSEEQPLPPSPPQ